ncbi:MAG: DUF2934 domain-containing protein [Planctomycetota bacterium]|nr:MAG: DUF2934 domain-containing protein [Planctomycetota bacterium]REJ95383.1 MAG: DUF2934 domain-containing protein [Planctomycetota bacterium]REK17584.1 MAG: DUF2934 domain-containing protein [Planctomycetota bacterium]REK39826.1 MAG: DUF2934 domain-containing protein [Planctomycetota bacterium]
MGNRKRDTSIQPRLESLLLTAEAQQAAKEEIERLAYLKWERAGRPPDAALRFWLEAEREWIAYCYVPRREGAAQL